MPKKKQKPVFSATDLWGNLVILPEETWLNHIVEPIDGHTEMKGYENLVKQVVVNPYEAYLSTQQSTAILFLSDPNVGPRPEGIRERDSRGVGMLAWICAARFSRDEGSGEASTKSSSATKSGPISVP